MPFLDNKYINIVMHVKTPNKQQESNDKQLLAALRCTCCPGLKQTVAVCCSGCSDHAANFHLVAIYHQTEYILTGRHQELAFRRGGPQQMMHLISFLGIGDYKHTHYADDSCQDRARLTRFAALAMAELKQADRVTVLATQKAEEKHGTELRTAFAVAGRAAPVFIRVKDGKSPEENRENFNTLIGLFDIAAGSTVIDITHGFRSQPFFAGAVIQYVRALGPDTGEIRIMYGAWEAGDQIDGGESPVWDLTDFADLGDWSAAIRTFIDTGHGQRLADRAEELGRDLSKRWHTQASGGQQPSLASTARALRDLCDGIDTVRVSALLLGSHKQPSLVTQVINAINQVDGTLVAHIPALRRPLMDLREQLAPLMLEDDHLGTPAARRAQAALARLYLRWGRLPEAAIVLREAWVCAYGPESANRPGEGFDVGERKQAEHRFQAPGSHPQAVTVGLIRNDVQHGGFNAQPAAPKRLFANLERLLLTFEAEIDTPAPPIQAGLVWFVTCHPGAAKWAKGQGIHIDHRVEHLDLDQIKEGDSVMGTLPLHLAAKICARRARFFNLSLEVPPDACGQTLSADELQRYGARLDEFLIYKLDEKPQD